MADRPRFRYTKLSRQAKAIKTPFTEASVVIDNDFWILADRPRYQFTISADRPRFRFPNLSRQANILISKSQQTGQDSDLQDRFTDLRPTGRPPILLSISVIPHFVFKIPRLKGWLAVWLNCRHNGFRFEITHHFRLKGQSKAKHGLDGYDQLTSTWSQSAFNIITCCRSGKWRLLNYTVFHMHKIKSQIDIRASFLANYCSALLRFLVFHPSHGQWNRPVKGYRATVCSQPEGRLPVPLSITVRPSLRKVSHLAWTQTN